MILGAWTPQSHVHPIRKATADGDVLREGVRVLAEAIMEAEVSELTSAARASAPRTVG